MSNHSQEIPPPFLSILKKWWIDSRERVSEWYRSYFHTGFVTLMLIVNLIFGYSASIIYLSRWKHSPGDPDTVLTSFFQNPPAILVDMMNFIFIPFDTWHWGWMLLIFNMPLLIWLYSTVTQPIMKGYKVIISWTSERGRIWACLLSAIPFMTIYCAIIACYVDLYLFDFFASIQSDKPHLVVKSMASFGYILMAAPVFMCAIGTYLVLKQFYVFEDLRHQFMTWEFPLLSKQSFSLKNNRCDVITGWERKTKKPIVLSEKSRYLHELVCGPTGSGKTSTTILIRITQDLIRIARGRKMSVVALEPKGDMIRDVLKIAKHLGIPDEKIKVVDPTDLVHSIKFNPFVGPMETAAETFRGVLNALTGDQDEFFKGQQEETASLYTLLGKLRYGNLFNIIHMQRMYTDPRYLADIVEEVRVQIDKSKEQKDLSEEDQVILERYEQIVNYFEDEVIEYKTWKDKEGEIHPVTYSENHRYAGRQVVENKKDKFVAGVKKYINDLSMNTLLSNLMVANQGEEVLDLDHFLEEGGVLLVNSALGELEELSVLFGQFFIRQFQSAVFRRPPEGEVKRDPLTNQILTDERGNPITTQRFPTFFYVDELPLYVNEAFERMLTLGRSYKVGTLIALQSLGQLQKIIPGYDRVILGNARNKTVFGGGEYQDNKAFSEQFGEEYQIEESLNESTTPVTMPGQRWDHRYNTQRKLMPRFSPTDIMEQKFKHFIGQFVNEDGTIQPPVEGVGKFVDETRFLKKFVNIGSLELETKRHKSLNIGSHLALYRNLFKTALDDNVDDIREDVGSEIDSVDSEAENDPKYENAEFSDSQIVDVSNEEIPKSPDQKADISEKHNDTSAGSIPSIIAGLRDDDLDDTTGDGEPNQHDHYGQKTLDSKASVSSPSGLNKSNPKDHSEPNPDQEEKIKELLKMVHHDLNSPVSDDQDNDFEWNVEDIEDSRNPKKQVSTSQQSQARQKIKMISDEEEDDI